MSHPFFSILVPTKNRNYLISNAIDSILRQSFEDYEIIVADNDDTDKTETVISRYSDNRLKYYRTGNLSMVDNWEFARQKASGEYLTVLEDKQVLVADSLGFINNTLASTKRHVLVWRVLDSANKNKQINQFNSIEDLYPDHVLNCYVNGHFPWKKLPRLINSCVSSVFIDKILEHSGYSYFFNYHSPDLVAAFLQLNYIDKYQYTDSVISYLISDISSASNIRNAKPSGSKYFVGGSNYDISNSVSHVPIKHKSFIFNTVYNDFIQVKTCVNTEGNLIKYKMTNLAYAKTCLLDLINILTVRKISSDEISDVYEYIKNNLSFYEKNLVLAWLAKAFIRKILIRKVSRFQLKLRGIN